MIKRETAKNATVIYPLEGVYINVTPWPMVLNLSDGREVKITALRETTQLPECEEGDLECGWIVVPEGYYLTEIVGDITHGQPACGWRGVLDLTGDVEAQILAIIEGN